MRQTLLALSRHAGGRRRARSPRPQRPFGTLREQAATQQAWLAQAARDRAARADAEVRRRHVGHARCGSTTRIRSSRSLVSPTTFAARRRTIYVFYDRGPAAGVERLALGGSNQGGLYQAFRSQKPIDGLGRRGRPHRGALGRAAVAAPQGGRRDAEAGEDRGQHLGDLGLRRRPLLRRAAGNARGPRARVDAAASCRPRALRWTSSRAGSPRKKCSTRTSSAWSGSSSRRCIPAGPSRRASPAPATWSGGGASA